VHQDCKGSNPMLINQSIYIIHTYLVLAKKSLKKVIWCSLNLNLCIFSVLSLADLLSLVYQFSSVICACYFNVLYLLYAETKFVLFVVNLAFGYVGLWVYCHSCHYVF
jgi:hypothetical protein